MGNIPAFLGQAKDGMRIAIDRYDLSFDSDGKPVGEMVTVVGVISNVTRVNQIPHAYITARLTDDAGRVHEIKSKPDYHIEIVPNRAAYLACIEGSVMLNDADEAEVVNVGGAGVEVSWTYNGADGVNFYTWTEVHEYGFSFRHPYRGIVTAWDGLHATVIWSGTRTKLTYLPAELKAMGFDFVPGQSHLLTRES